MNLVRRLNALGKEVNARYESLNCGGCAVYAALVAEELVKLGVNVRGITASYCMMPGTDIDKVRPKIAKGNPQEWGDNGVYFGHVGLEFEHNGKLRHYDSNGVKAKGRRLMELPIYNGRLTPKELKTIAGTDEGWNRSFNRRHIPTIRRMVKAHMAKVDLTPSKGRRQASAAA